VSVSDIMIVDDNPANLRLLEEMLLEQGHEVRSFPLGRLALASATKDRPDLILLDINMPEMNGYEVCERLKSSEILSHIPVIFLSALNETEDKVKAFQSGAVDYISKPFQFDEVHARVETHLKMNALKQALELQNERLEETVAARTCELAEAYERLTILDRSKNHFLNLISHELRTPLNGLVGVGELILEEMAPTNENNELRGLFDESRRRILSLLDDALLLTQIDVAAEQFRSAHVSLPTVLDRAIEKTKEFADSRHVALEPPSVCLDLPLASNVLANEDLLLRALHALLDTAVRLSVKGEKIHLACETASDSTRVIIESHGTRIPSAVVPRFFDLFSVEEASIPGKDLGLGPAVASRILSLFGASVALSNQDDPPQVQFTISLKNRGQ
jgi:two-component system sensor histidine kinase/response regulator